MKIRDEIDKKTIFLFKIANFFLRNTITIKIIKNNINKFKKIFYDFKFFVKMIKILRLKILIKRL